MSGKEWVEPAIRVEKGEGGRGGDTNERVFKLLPTILPPQSNALDRMAFKCTIDPPRLAHRINHPFLNVHQDVVVCMLVDD